jgi:hypothetical protein
MRSFFVNCGLCIVHSALRVGVVHSLCLSTPNLIRNSRNSLVLDNGSNKGWRGQQKFL